jgi:type I site-specific restriction endonuclease
VYSLLSAPPSLVRAIDSVSQAASTPEQRARAQIDAALLAAGWVVQGRDGMNLSASRGVAVREFKLAPGYGFADYLLFVDGKAAGVLEAKPEGHTLSGVEVQIEKYSAGLPAGLHPPVEPLPFLYLSTGAVAKFTNLLDPDPRSRRIFQVHQPETLAEWLAANTLDTWVKPSATSPPPTTPGPRPSARVCGPCRQWRGRSSSPTSGRRSSIWSSRSSGTVPARSCRWPRARERRSWP